MKNGRSTIIFVVVILLVFFGLLTYKFTSERVKGDTIDVSHVILNEEFFSVMNAKELIHYKIMNSIDFFTTATGKFQRIDLPNKLEEEVTYQVDVKNRRGYSHITNTDNDQDLEILCSNGINLQFDNIKKTYKENKIEVLAKDKDLKKLKPINRFSKKDGYLARSDNEYLLGTEDSLFNQSVACSYLNNYSNWSITGEEKYMGIDCVKIVGVMESTGKTHENNFILIVDKSTGIILKSQDLDMNGKVIYSMTTESIKIDGSLDNSAFEKTVEGYSKDK